MVEVTHMVIVRKVALELTMNLACFLLVSYLDGELDSGSLYFQSTLVFFPPCHPVSFLWC